ncbi:hypothetical protein [Streptomyces sp. NPDC093598]|uniref:DUF7144 family membrane protein n=1 Tax=Streptomyces sp. NPDC093598 TaxID=3366046 RepID=UPI00382ED4EF
MPGIAEIAEDDIFASTRNYVFAFDLSAWGWIHLALGMLAFVVSFGLFMASTWARVLGVGITGLVIIALSGFIIRALCVMRGVMRKDDASVPFERAPNT